MADRELRPIPDEPGVTWSAVNAALMNGVRGLPGGSSLPRLLARCRGVTNKRDQPKLTEEEILAWADDWHDITGKWPNGSSGPIPLAGGATWAAMDIALRTGCRGLPGGSSLGMLLFERRAITPRRPPPALTVEEILAWADQHYRRTGAWPKSTSGPIPHSAGES